MRGHLIHWQMLSFTREQKSLWEETVTFFSLLSKPEKTSKKQKNTAKTMFA